MASHLVKARIQNATAPKLLYATNAAVSSPSEVSGVLVADSVYSFTLTGLADGTQYYYRLSDLGVLWRKTGKFKTLPAVGAANFMFAVGGCAVKSSGGAVSNAITFDKIRARNPDFLLHLGDIDYRDLNSSSVSAFRAAYVTLLSQSRQAALYKDVPIHYIWSDHDRGPNDNDSTFVGSAATQQAYKEYVPVSTLAASDGLYRTFVVGRVRFVITDCRTFKSAKAATDNASKTMFGATQKQWIKDTLLAATEPLIFLVMDGTWIVPANAGDDWWSGYTTERAEIAEWLEDNGRTTKTHIIHGDSHALLFDNGTNSQYDTGSLNPGPRVLCSSCLDQTPAVIGGPYSGGTFTSQRFMYATVSVADVAGTITITVKGYSIASLTEVETEEFSYTANYS